MFTVTSDGSVIDSSGKILYFSIYRFIKDICQGNCCFICGISPFDAEFNNEHILPNWVLRNYNLHSKFIELPNNANVRYGQYKIPCCKKCNSLMGKKIEEPVYDLIFKGYEAVEQYILQNGTWLFFKWLALIFFKTHLKDKFLNLYKDRRQGQDEKISDLYNWENLHHIHCIARSFYTGCKLDSKVHGSLLVFRATLENFEEVNFDYVNLYTSRTTLLRIGEVAFISVLNDSWAAVQLTHHWWRGITNSLSPIQLKEIVARLAITNLNIKKRPEFFSEINMYREHYLISAKLPERWRLKKYDNNRYGKILYCLCEKTISSPPNVHLERLVKQGKFTFLYDHNGQFITNSMEVV